ncbi:phosphatase PAP2 family protein [Paractinoplanes brasiliensis]|uniref:Undecaprenyl-diphosphatase n=1 Tax=Paractinoplanes brasiliensis TaxID=52695 RepID=A0A4R6J6J9_9ACTN|nr:phosphatase PAP2 family protein [Actinoplanes brasiliensis]TDO31072.1 undecaprenyl-diphosphatase [Actinoplanes brasiliensis]GID33294.1 phosphatase PAP2 family protein [Actinoplanes brasiliensis]
MRDENREHALEIRLAVAATGAVVLLVPFAVIAALVVGNVGWLHALDRDVSVPVHDFSAAHPGWAGFMWWWCLVFDPWTWRAAALALVIWLVRRGARPQAWWVAITMIAGGLLGVLLKLLFERERPAFLDPVATAVGYSFPSGHALNNALGAAVVVMALWPAVRRRRLLLAAGVVIPVLTGLFRIGLGVHWLSDVVGGWLLGLAVVAATTAAFSYRRSRKLIDAQV